jgi:hypothetical protein
MSIIWDNSWANSNLLQMFKESSFLKYSVIHANNSTDITKHLLYLQLCL